MRTRWSKEKAWDWYNRQQWVMGINYVPAITVGGELWQEDLHDEVMESVKKEFHLIDLLGVNSVRMFFPFNIWYYDRNAFLDRVEDFLDLAGRHGVSLMPVLFNDCVNFGRPKDITPHRPHGWQKYDIGHHGGHKSNPFTGEKNLKGWIYWDEPEWRDVLEEYERAFIGRFAKDERIYAWDLWNEPGNSNRHDMSIPYLRKAFEIARDVNPDQPLTAGVWIYPDDYGTNPEADVEPIGRTALDESDIITFHEYEPFDRVKTVAERLSKEGYPMLNTEWMNRVQDNMIKDILPLFHSENIGSYSWGLVAGKCQHFLPWDDIRNNPGVHLERWQHDLFDVYQTAYDPEEVELMRKLSPKKVL